MGPPAPRRLSRRSVLIGGGIATLGFGYGGIRSLMSEPLDGFSPNHWLSIDASGTVHVVCPGLELGQGSTQALPMILAEELRADFSRVVARAAQRDDARYGNPEFMGRLVTADSKTTSGYFDLLRLAGAQARLVLIASAAQLEGWRAGDCEAKEHAIRHRPSERILDFGEIARRGSMPLVPLTATPADLAQRAAYNIIGTSPPAANLRDKITGRAVYGIDARSADALIAVVVRGRQLGATPIRVTDLEARAVPGVVQIVTLPDGVAVVATDTWAALTGAQHLDVDWSGNEDFDSDLELDRLDHALADPAAGATVREVGDATAALAGAVRVLTGSFHAPPVTHIALEPINAEARPHTLGLGIDVAGSTQSADLDMRSAARAGKTAPFMISTRQHLVGGAFGRRVVNPAVTDAVRIAKSVGRPVQVVRPLADDIRRGQVRPAAAQLLEAGLDATGEVISWRHRVASDSVLARMLPETLAQKAGIDNTATDGLLHGYRIPHQRIAWRMQTAPPEPGFLRGVSAGYTAWAIETMVDRIARETGRDPLDWRLAHLDEPRARRVLETVGDIARWTAPRESGQARGLAFLGFRGSFIATVAEAHLKAGKLRVTSLFIAADVGLAIHPRNVVGQIEGAAILGLSFALSEELGFRAGATVAGGLSDYPVLRADSLPAISVRLVGGEDATRPNGAGEIGVPTIAPAVGNAIAALTGRYPDRLPLSL